MKKLLLSFCALCVVSVCFADGDTTTSETTKDVVITFDPESTDQEFRGVVFNISGFYRNGEIYLEIQPSPTDGCILVTNEGLHLIYLGPLYMNGGRCNVDVGSLCVGEHVIEIQIDDAIYTGYFTIE